MKHPPAGDKERIEIQWRSGRPLEEGKHPGLRPGTAVEDGVRIERDVAVPMRDGVKIYTDIYRPAGAPAATVPARRPSISYSIRTPS